MGSPAASNVLTVSPQQKGKASSTNRCANCSRLPSTERHGQYRRQIFFFARDGRNGGRHSYSHRIRLPGMGTTPFRLLGNVLEGVSQLRFLPTSLSFLRLSCSAQRALFSAS